MTSMIQAISYSLPEYELSNEQITKLHPEWPIDKIFSKTGIKKRHIAATTEYSLELAIKAGRRLFSEHNINPTDIDFIIFCSQTPKYLIPTSSCILQDTLGLKTTVGAMDVNQGCSGYVYSLMLADSLINSQHAKSVLLITSDTYSKLIEPHDRSLKTIFGDAATASIISKANKNGIGRFEYGCDGKGAEKLIAQASGMYGLMKKTPYQPDLYMDGAAIFNFTLEVIPNMVNKILERENLCPDEIDLYIFHQANVYILENLRRKIGINPHNFFIHLEDIGNTVSSSIPIALAEAIKQKRVKIGTKIMLVGFGVGLSWAATIIQF